MLKELRAKLLTPAARRTAVIRSINTKEKSQRRALVGRAEREQAPQATNQAHPLTSCWPAPIRDTGD